MALVGIQETGFFIKILHSSLDFRKNPVSGSSRDSRNRVFSYSLHSKLDFVKNPVSGFANYSQADFLKQRQQLDDGSLVAVDSKLP